jgi:hypothetical protein
VWNLLFSMGEPDRYSRGRIGSGTQRREHGLGGAHRRKQLSQKWVSRLRGSHRGPEVYSRGLPTFDPRCHTRSKDRAEPVLES